MAGVITARQPVLFKRDSPSFPYLLLPANNLLLLHQAKNLSYVISAFTSCAFSSKNCKILP